MIKLDFSIGFSNKEILIILVQNHYMILSIHTLKRCWISHKFHIFFLKDLQIFLMQENIHIFSLNFSEYLSFISIHGLFSFRFADVSNFHFFFLPTFCFFYIFCSYIFVTLYFQRISDIEQFCPIYMYVVFIFSYMAILHRHDLVHPL